MGDIQVIFEYLSGHAVWWGLLLLTLSAMIEYVVPPFPGDTVTIVGSVLIPTAGWPLAGVFGAVMLGSMAGAALDWWVGYWIATNEERETWVHRFLDREKVRPKIDKLKDQFRRHGAVYISLNRFMPAFRALFFLAAGLAKLDVWRVLFFAAVSAALWNGALLGLGYFVGYKIETIAYWVDQYSTGVWIAVGLFLIGWVIFRVVRPLEEDDS